MHEEMDGRVTVEKSFAQGAHFVYVEARDDGGKEMLSLSFTRLSLDLSVIWLHITISRMSVIWRKREIGDGEEVERERIVLGKK